MLTIYIFVSVSLILLALLPLDIVEGRSRSHFPRSQETEEYNYDDDDYDVQPKFNRHPKVDTDEYFGHDRQWQNYPHGRKRVHEGLRHRKGQAYPKRSYKRHQSRRVKDGRFLGGFLKHMAPILSNMAPMISKGIGMSKKLGQIVAPGIVEKIDNYAGEKIADLAMGAMDGSNPHAEKMLGMIESMGLEFDEGDEEDECEPVSDGKSGSSNNQTAKNETGGLSTPVGGEAPPLPKCEPVSKTKPVNATGSPTPTTSVETETKAVSATDTPTTSVEIETTSEAVTVGSTDSVDTTEGGSTASSVDDEATTTTPT